MRHGARAACRDQPAPTASVSGQVRDESGRRSRRVITSRRRAVRSVARRGRTDASRLAAWRAGDMRSWGATRAAAGGDSRTALAGGSRSVILELKVPGITEVTTVATSNPIVDVQNATVGTNFGGAMLRDIPNQRDVFALLAQTPGITMPRPDVGGNTAGTQSLYRAYGLSGQSITTVDGVNITSGADLVGAYIDYGALAEATVAAAGNSAEVPVAGAAVTTVIKSGGNTHARGVLRRLQTRRPQTLRRCRALCAVSRHQWPARRPVHQGPALVLHVIPRSVHRAHDRDVRPAAGRGRHPGSAVHHPNDRIHHQAESSTRAAHAP